MRIISGFFRNQQLNSPKGKAVRPTSEKLRACLFNICQNDIADASFLDLFAGSGAMGLEALSRGASSATFVELDKMAANCIRENIERLKVQDQAKLFQGNVFQIVQRWVNEHKSFDIIYADPPYQSHLIEDETHVSFNHKLLKIIDNGSLLSTSGQLFLEDASIKDEEQQWVDKQLQRLYLKSIRRFGQSLLRQYLFKSDEVKPS
jgi:16S rRNA (guanine966-N2)-methyltransferase